MFSWFWFQHWNILSTFFDRLKVYNFNHNCKSFDQKKKNHNVFNVFPALVGFVLYVKVYFSLFFNVQLQYKSCTLIFSTCTNGTFACGKESCEEQIVCPKNQVYRKGVTACRKTCELYGRQMICDNDVLMDGCVCDESNNQTTYMAPDVSHCPNY